MGSLLRQTDILLNDILSFISSNFQKHPTFTVFSSCLFVFVLIPVNGEYGNVGLLFLYTSKW